jgi:ABC-2 type transport system permease protein
MSAFSFGRRFVSLVRKETRQLLRDRSNLAVGLILPGMLIVLFGYGLSFDVTNAPVAIVLEDTAPQGHAVLAGLEGSPYIAPVWTSGMPDAVERMRAGKVGGIVRLNTNDLEDWLVRQRDRSMRMPAHAPALPGTPADDVTLRLIA